MTCRAPTSGALVVCAAALAACGDGMMEPAGAPATLTVVAGERQKATVATAVAIPPSVRVTDADGRPVRGVPVTFAVTAGGGTVVGSPATTDANGVATIMSWTLGTGAWMLGREAGSHTLTVTGAGLPAVIIGATANPGPPARAEKASADGDSALPFFLVRQPAVKVEDAYGNPVPDVMVGFRVSAGGGSLTQTAPGYLDGGTLTDLSGVARVSWRLGGIGVQTVTAVVHNLPPLTFTATAVDPCVFMRTDLTIGSAVNANISYADCPDGVYGRRDVYTLTLAEQQEFVLGLNSTELLVGYRLDGAGRQILTTWMTALDTPHESRFILPAGSHPLRAMPATFQGRGNYRIATTPGLPNDCGTTHTVRGITVIGSLVQDDCVSESNGQHYFDRYAVYLHPGDRLSVSVQAEGSWVTEIRTTELIATSGEPRTNPGATITATAEGYYYVVLINATNDLATGDYTLTIGQ